MDLSQGVDEMDLTLPEETQQRLIQYLLLLEKWNKTYNLTAIRKIEEMVPLHLLDSLRILPFLEGRRFIDVGSGAGLPGLVVAIAAPETQWVLLDSNQKKTRFLQQARIELGLENVEVVHSRIEDYQDAGQFDLAVSRAVATLSTLLAQVHHLCPNLLAMKGQIPEDELKEIPEECMPQVHQVQVPGIEAQRSIIILRPKNQR